MKARYPWTCSSYDLAHLLKVTVKEVRQLARLHIVKREGKWDLYAVEASVRGYCEFLRGQLALQAEGQVAVSGAALESSRVERYCLEAAFHLNHKQVQQLIRQGYRPRREVERKGILLPESVQEGS